MTPEQINSLPPELRKAAEWCDKLLKMDLSPLSADLRNWLAAALSYILQVVGERDQAHNHKIIAEMNSNLQMGKIREAEATIATLTAERDQADADKAEWKRMSLALTTLLRAKCSEKEWREMEIRFEAALYHPSEGGGQS